MSDAHVYGMDGGRRYSVDGFHLPGVTSIMSVEPNPFLDAWRERIGHANADAIRDAAARRGTRIHKMLEDVLTGHPADTSLSYWHPAVELFKTWAGDSLDTVIGSEIPIVHRALGYAGTADLVAVLKGHSQPTVVDFKTGKSVRHAPVQLEAYRLALHEMGIDTDGFVILHLRYWMRTEKSYEMDDAGYAAKWLNSLRWENIVSTETDREALSEFLRLRDLWYELYGHTVSLPSE